VFVVDSSESITKTDPTYWTRILTFMNNVTNYFSIASNATRVGVVLYSDRGVIAFNLTSYATRTRLRAAISRLPHLRSYTDTYDGLSKMRTLFTAEYGDREEVSNVAVIIADGDHSPGLEDPLDEANRAWADGIYTISIGLNEATENETAALSTPPQEEGKTYWMSSFDELATIVSDVQNAVCDLTGDACTLGEFSQAANHSGRFNDCFQIV
jgi:hypothetical protein